MNDRFKLSWPGGGRGSTRRREMLLRGDSLTLSAHPGGVLLTTLIDNKGQNPLLIRQAQRFRDLVFAGWLQA
jgi:hypothetical protein